MNLNLKDVTNITDDVKEFVLGCCCEQITVRKQVRYVKGQSWKSRKWSCCESIKSIHISGNIIAIQQRDSLSSHPERPTLKVAHPKIQNLGTILHTNEVVISDFDYASCSC